MKDVSREVDVKDFIAKEVPYFFLNFGFILLQQIEQATARHEWVPRLSELWLA